MIPDEAVEAARDAMKRFEVQCDPDGRYGWDAYARIALEAAAPHLMASALDDAATIFQGRLPDGTGNGRAYNSYQVADMLRARAAATRNP